MPKSWKPEVQVDGTWSTNSLRFATEEEAKKSAYSIFQRWMLATGHRATPSDDPVNYAWANDKLNQIRVGVVEDATEA